MARAGVTVLPPDWDPAATRVVDGYRARLGATLAGSARQRAAVLAEITDGLIEATDAHRAAGMTAAAAARAAVTEFGDPTELARMLAAEQAGVTGHRVGLALMVTGPLVGVAWLSAHTVGGGLHWYEQIDALLAKFPMVVVALGVGPPAAVLAAAAGAGWWMRRLALSPRWAAGAAIIAACAVVVGDSALLTGFAASGGVGWSRLAVLAAGVSTARLGLAAVAATRCARLRIAAR